MGKGSSGGAASDADEYRNIGACSLVFIAFFWVSGGICKFTLEPTGKRYLFFSIACVVCTYEVSMHGSVGIPQQCYFQPAMHGMFTHVPILFN